MGNYFEHKGNQLLTRIPQLDGLRGLAIALVLVNHYSQPLDSPILSRLTSLGWSGVDLFFVLSGFLIGGIVMDARGSANYFQVFYLRRVCRIFPLYFAFLAAAAIAVHFSPSLLFHGQIPWQAEVVFLQNVWLSAHQSVLGDPTWSLAVEEQFYLILPAVIYFVKPSRLPWVLSAGIVLAPIIRLAIYAANPQLTSAIYVLLPCRMNALLLGVAGAYFLRQPGAWRFLQAHRRKLWTALEMLTVGCLAFLIRPNVTSPLEMFLGFDYFALLYALLLIMALVDEGLAKVLQAKWLMRLGTIAYGLYLLHYPIFALTQYAMRRAHIVSGLSVAAVALPLTILIAQLSWKWFERPFVRLGHRALYGSGILPIAAPAVYSKIEARGVGYSEL